MMKRMIALVLGVIFLFSMSTVAFAAENKIEEANNVGTRSTSTNLGKYVTLDGIKFYLFGYCYTIGTKPAAYTEYSIRYYNGATEDEQDLINNAKKTLGAGGLATTSVESSFSGTSVLSGSSNSYVKVGTAQSTTIQYITGNHYIKYNGDTGQGSSWYSNF